MEALPGRSCPILMPTGYDASGSRPRTADDGADQSRPLNSGTFVVAEDRQRISGCGRFTLEAPSGGAFPRCSRICGISQLIRPVRAAASAAPFSNAAPRCRRPRRAASRHSPASIRDLLSTNGSATVGGRRSSLERRRVLPGRADGGAGGGKPHLKRKRGRFPGPFTALIVLRRLSC